MNECFPSIAVPGYITRAIRPGPPQQREKPLAPGVFEMPVQPACDGLQPRFASRQLDAHGPRRGCRPGFPLPEKNIGFDAVDLNLQGSGMRIPGSQPKDGFPGFSRFPVILRVAKSMPFRERNELVSTSPIGAIPRSTFDTSSFQKNR